MRKKKKSEILVGVVDFETDPFLFGRVPKPCACEFHSDQITRQFWGEDCAQQLIVFLETLEPHIIYAHNGGKFDFFYFLEMGALTNPAMMINGRIVKCGLIGLHELRDSFAILPVPLAAMEKMEFDYKKLESDVRHLYKTEILEYLHDDCRVLLEWTTKFIERFGQKITIGSTAIKKLGEYHLVERLNKYHDERFRKYYFGGRVECFEVGEITGNFKLYDVNSMYPHAMREYDHPVGSHYINIDETNLMGFDPRTGRFERDKYGVYFIEFVGLNYSALPTRVPDGVNKGAIAFDQEYGVFYACSHELIVGLEIGRVRIDKIINIWVPTMTQRFDSYVDVYSAEKINAKKSGDSVSELFAKLLLNSAYGKFATNPEKFNEWFICDTWDSNSVAELELWRGKHETEFDENGAIVKKGAELANDMGRYEIWQAPTPDERGYYDVACAASITSASRSILLRAIHFSNRPIYCDTDSLLCEQINNVPIDDSALGAWKCEGSTNRVWIAGKKMYGFQFNEWTKNKKGIQVQKIKIASKGAKLTLEHIKELCSGKIVTWVSDAPNFKMKIIGADDRENKNDIITKFISRDIRFNAKKSNLNKN